MNAHKKIFMTSASSTPKKEEKKSPPSLKIVDYNREKMEYEHLKNLISTKLKDPAMAKKAALIIAEMIKDKKEK